MAYVGEQLLWSQFQQNVKPGASLLAHLGATGDGSGPPLREWYERFIRKHRQDGLSSLLEEFPVFGRLLGTVWLLWLESSVELLERIINDDRILDERFSIPSGATLCDIQQGLGDPHKGGRAVAILSFRAGNKQQKVVYKPKDMRLDQAYQELLEDLNRQSQQPALKTLTIHSGEGYGYAEYVAHRLCTGKAQLPSFYHNAGRLTAVLYILGCTDCHYENLIASGSQIVLSDTETLLEEDVSSHPNQTTTESTDDVLSSLQVRFRSSILRSGMLPIWNFFSGGKIAMDVSALGVAPPTKDKRSFRGWLGLNSDGMLQGRVLKFCELPTSLPVGIGSKNPLNDHLDVFCEGFYSQCQELIARKDDLLRAGGMLDHFSGLPRRTLFRATRVYFLIQHQQLHPEALRSPLQQGMRLEQLARSFLLDSERPPHWAVFTAELRQMEQLDIPVFMQVIGRNSLPSADDKPFVKFSKETNGLKASRDRLADLDEETIDFQIRLIRGSCEARVIREPKGESPLVQRATESMLPSSALSTEQRLSEASGVMQSLIDLAIRDKEGDIEWLGLGLGGDSEKFTFGPVGLSLYGGSSGVALLCARLMRLGQSYGFPIDNKELETIVHGVIKPINELAREGSRAWRLRLWRDQGLGLNGCGGVLLFLLGLEHEGWQSSGLSPRELSVALLADAHKDFLGNDFGLDIIGGCAGLIGPLLRLGTSRALELAMAAGDRLLDTQQEVGGWVGSANTEEAMLLGFSHGAAGYAAALAALYRVGGDLRFLNAARRALTYERDRFDTKHCNWPDYRQAFDDQDNDSSLKASRFMTSWCHGAPGIALARACLWGTDLWDDEAAEEIRIALNTTATLPMLVNDHLCCGSLGIAAILRHVGGGPWVLNPQDKTRWLNQAEHILQESLARRAAHGGQFLCLSAREGSLLLPGFFNGLSGMGMVLADTEQQESFLPQVMASGLFPSLS